MIQVGGFFRESISLVEHITGHTIDVMSLSYNRMMNHIRYMVARAVSGEKLKVNILYNLDCVNKQLKALRKRVVLSHLSHARFFLLILSMLMFPPFNGLTKFRWFRHHYETIVLAFARCAIYWDKVLSVRK